MSLVGAGYGAAKSLEEIVADRVLRQKLEQEIAERQQRFELDQQRVNESAKQNEYERSRTDRLDAENTAATAAKADQDATARRGRSNMAGVLSMGLDPATAKREIAYSSLQSGANVPSGVMESLTPARDPNADYRARKQIDQEFEKPPTAPKPGVHVVGGNLVDDSGRVLFTDPNKVKTGEGAGPSPYSTERAQRTIENVDAVIGDVNGWSAGYGSLLSNIPESQALNLKSKLNTLKANIAFNELTAMREASKTGGALGSIAVRELELLESTLGSLDQAQSPQQLIENLTKIRASVQRWQAAGGQSASPMQPVSSHGGPAPSSRVDELLAMYGRKP